MEKLITSEGDEAGQEICDAVSGQVHKPNLYNTLDCFGW